MKVIHVIRHLRLSGINRVVADLALHQVKSGDSVVVAALSEEAEIDNAFSAALATSLREAGVALEFLGTGIGLQAVLALRKQMKACGCDIVHSHEISTDILSHVASRGLAAGHVRTIHNFDVHAQRSVHAARLIERGLAGSRIVGVSDAVSDRMRLFVPTACHGRVRTIRNGIDLAVREARRPEVPRFAYFGRNAVQKGLDFLPASAPALRRYGARLEVFAPANGAYDLTSLLAEDCFDLRQPSADASSSMRDYDAVIVPSRFEGLGLVAVEALAQGIPVIVTPAPGLMEVIGPDYPYTATAIDGPELAATVEKLCHDLQKGRVAGAIAETVARVRGMFSRDQMNEGYAEVYRQAKADMS